MIEIFRDLWHAWKFRKPETRARERERIAREVWPLLANNTDPIGFMLEACRLTARSPAFRDLEEYRGTWVEPGVWMGHEVRGLPHGPESDE